MKSALTTFLVPILMLMPAVAAEPIRPPIKEDSSCRGANAGGQFCKFESTARLIGYSTPGIAYQPTNWSCKRPRRGGATVVSGKPKRSIVGSWRAIKLQGWTVPEKRVVYLEFGKNGFMRASAGCNSIGGQYAIKNGKITLSNVTSTLMLCHGQAMKAESKLKDTIFGKRTFWATDDELLILDAGDKRVGLFRRDRRS